MPVLERITPHTWSPPTQTTSDHNQLMQNTKLYLYAASLMACTSATFTSGAAEAATPAESGPPPLYRPWSVGAEAGSTGLGGSGSWRFADHFGVRAGFYYF